MQGPAIQAVQSTVNFNKQVIDAFERAYAQVEEAKIPPEKKREITENLRVLEGELKKSKEGDAGAIQRTWLWLNRNASWVVPTLIQVVSEGVKAALGLR